MTFRFTFLFVLLITFSITGIAQPYYQVTAQNGQWQSLGGISVRADRTGFPFCQGKYLASPGFCGVYPYYIGDCGRNGWKYTFTNPVTHIRIHMASLNDDDTVRISIPVVSGPPQVIQLSAVNLTNWASSCNPTTTAAITTGAGLLTASGAPSGYSDVQIDIQNPKYPYNFTVIQVEHLRSFGNTTADGVVYDLSFKDDTCGLDFDVITDKPQCSGRPVQLHASAYPNTTHKWSTHFNSWTATGSDPVLPNASVTMNGFYVYDTATRGTCTYIDSARLFLDLTPAITTARQKGPKCPGENDTLFVNSTQATYEWFGPNSFLSGLPNPVLSNIQKSDEGTYYVFAKSLSNGCLSDTVAVKVKVNDPAVAIFDYEMALGCTADTVRFRNLSINSGNASWSFGDGGTSTLSNPEHVYVSPAMPAFYTVTLKVGNGLCSDDTSLNIIFDHPLKAEFSIDDDSICQNTIVNLKNKSVVAPATIPIYSWDMKDGTVYNFIDVAHKYERSGVYTLTLIVTDYLGCKDTATHLVVVDSMGSIGYDGSGSDICLGNKINFEGYFSPWGINNTVWDFGDGSVINNISKVSHAFDKPGIYEVAFTADYRICPDTTFKQKVIVKPHPHIDLGPDRTICPNTHPVELKDLINEGNPAAKWKWNTETINTSSSILVYHPGVYAATVELDGCESTDSVLVEKSCYIDIPNAFTPNGDGMDDYFLPKNLLSKGLIEFSMTIFNRWGQPVFRTNSTDGRGWDGKFNNEPQPMGVYVYLVEAKFLNGAAEKYQGNITLLR